MSTASPRRLSLLRRVAQWLPADTGDRRLRVAVWATLVVQTLIVGTGGLVRLTGSGLGCPTWPRCTPESFVATPEMGVHGVIEFGNRLLTFVLVIVAIVTFLMVLRLRRERPELFRLALVIGLGIPAQAVIGGISVLTGLNPYVVGLHFVVSAVLVALSTVLVVRVIRGPRGTEWAAAPPARIATHVASLLVAITVLVGILTTGSGPHAGDSGAARNGLDSELLQHVHSWPAYALAAVTVALVLAAWARPGSLPRVPVTALLAVEVVQISVGLWQARTGLPPFLVGAHMVLACLAVAAMTWTVLSLRAPARAAVSA